MHFLKQVLATAVLLLVATAQAEYGLLEYEFKIAEPNEVGAERFLGRDERIGNYNYLSYSMNVIIYPCLGHDPDCCMDRFGTPEYIRQSFKTAAGWLWAAGKEDRDPYVCQKPCFGFWTRIEETSTVYDYHFDYFEADESVVWAMNYQTKSLFMRKLDYSTPWEFINGDVLTLSATGPHSVYIIEGATNQLLVCTKPCTGEWKIPTESSKHPTPGAKIESPKGYKFIYVDSDRTHIWMVAETGEIFMRRLILEEENKIWEDITDGDWSDISPKDQPIKQVSVSVADNTVWVLGKDGIVSACVKPCADANWQSAPIPPGGVFKYIDADDTNLYGTTSVAGYVYKRKVSIADIRESWMSIPSSKDKSFNTLAAWETQPDSGFAMVATSSNPIKESKILEFYSVAEYGRACRILKSKESCNYKMDEGCIWNEDAQKCELIVPKKYSRVTDEVIAFDDPDCVVVEIIGKDGEVRNEAGYSIVKKSENVKLAVERDLSCVEHGVRKQLPDKRPVCWDHNETVRADISCFDALGVEHDYCMTVGYTSTVFIPQCGKHHRESEACGSFIEVHLPGDKRAISRTRIPLDSPFTNGYRTMIVATDFQALPDNENAFGFPPTDTRKKVICRGDYELWWVQYTRGRRIVEYIKKIYISYPVCDWNAGTDSYLEYYVIK